MRFRTKQKESLLFLNMTFPEYFFIGDEFHIQFSVRYCTIVTNPILPKQTLEIKQSTSFSQLEPLILVSKQQSILYSLLRYFLSTSVDVTFQDRHAVIQVYSYFTDIRYSLVIGRYSILFYITSSLYNFIDLLVVGKQLISRISILFSN